MAESWLFIGGYFAQFAGNSLLLAQVARKQSVYGLSADTQLCLLLSTLSRWAWSMDTRLIETPLAYVELTCTTLISMALLFYSWKYSYTNVTKGNKRFPIPSFGLALISMILAIFIHPGAKVWSVQILVAFTIYLEACAILPQLDMMRKMHEIEPLTSNSVTLIMISRLIRMGFWIALFFQNENFLSLFLADVAHCLFSLDYLVNWVRKLRPGADLLIKS